MTFHSSTILLCPWLLGRQLLKQLLQAGQPVPAATKPWRLYRSLVHTSMTAPMSSWAAAQVAAGRERQLKIGHASASQASSGAICNSRDAKWSQALEVEICSARLPNGRREPSPWHWQPWPGPPERLAWSALPQAVPFWETVKCSPLAYRPSSTSGITYTDCIASLRTAKACCTPNCRSRLSYCWHSMIQTA